ncbi:MAG: cation diffusion facilitator family transporter [Gammaproteobacteria bacterium]
MEESASRNRAIRNVLLLEGASDLLILIAKLWVGLTTGSSAVLSDALHSLTDLSNNILALVVFRISWEPPDAGHPYGHRKFETLAVFVLATLLSVTAIEIILRAFERSGEPVLQNRLGLIVMLGVLSVNIIVAAWEANRARRLDSELLRADARHTLSDVLVTVAVIVGWQLAARGYPIFDLIFALFVAGLVFYFAFGLFRRAVPVLVDGVAVDARTIRDATAAVPGVKAVRRIRSRRAGGVIVADLVVMVDSVLSTVEAHKIADEIERRLAGEFGIADTTVHIEPWNAGRSQR